MSPDPTILPPDLPVPQDDGACDHLGRGAYERLPAIELACTDGTRADVSRLARPGDAGVVVFCYPRTGVPGEPPSAGFRGESWESIPGARGCTPQSCSFRDALGEFARRGVRVFGLSTNTTAHQREFKSRMAVQYEFLSDADLALTRALRLPTFEFPVESGGPTTLLRRMAMFIEPAGAIAKVWYPVFPPNRNAEMVLFWLDGRAARASAPRAADVRVRAIEHRDLTWVREQLTAHFGAPQIVSRGVWHDADRLPGFITESGVQRLGLAAHTSVRRGEECELVALVSTSERAGVGTRLLEACVRAARDGGAARIFLTTTNDNTDALRFYQKRGWRLAALHAGAMAAARREKPFIPLVGHHGIEIRDDLELEVRLGGSSSTDGR